MAKEKSLLEQRAEERAKFHANRREEMRVQRAVDPNAYVKSMLNGAQVGTIGSPARAKKEPAKPKEKPDRQPSRLVQEMQAMSAKLNGNKHEIEGRQREKENAAREARSRDIAAKNEVKREQQSSRNFEMVANVFKDQGDKMVKAIRELGKKKDVGGKDEGGDKEPTLADMIDQYQDYRKKKKQNERGRRRSARRARAGTRRPRPIGSDPIGGEDEFDIADFDDPGSDDRQRSRRDAKRERRLKRIRDARRASGGRNGAWNRARGFGGRVVGGAGEMIGGIANSGVAGKLATGAKVLGGIGALASAADVAYNSAPLVGKVFDSNEDTATRIGAGAHLAVTGAGGVIGGALGGVQGAAYGAAAGDAVATGAEWLGRKIADNIDVYDMIHDKDGIVQKTGTAIGSGLDAVQQSAFGKTLGVSAAIAMAPFSEDARKALKNDWERSILPKFDETFDNFTGKIGNLAAGISQASAQIYDGVKNAGKSAWQGVKDAGAQISDGYKKGGWQGALKAVDGTASKVGAGIKKGYGDIKEGVSSAGSALKYASEKGTANTLDLALGFQAKKGFSGLSDSQSKAYAANVMKTESGGALGITNQYGFSGQYQFGADALADNGLIDKAKLTAAKKAAGGDWYKGGLHKKFMEDNSNWKNEGGRDAFLKDKQLQDDTFVKYTNRNIEAGYRSGALTAKSSAEDIAGYAKAAHLKGSGGADNYFLRGIDSTDANGTKVSDYAKGASNSMMALSAKVDDAKAKGLVPLAVDPSKQLAKKDAKGNVVTTASTPATQSKTPVSGSTAPTPLNKTEIVKAEPKTVTKVAGSATPDSKKSLSEQVQSAQSPERNSVTGSILSAEASVKPRASDVNYSVTPFATNAAPTASAKAAPIPMVASNTPPEMQTVTVANPTPAAEPSKTTVVQQGGGQQSGAPTLQEMPMMINDMGLVLLNIGHV